MAEVTLTLAEYHELLAGIAQPTIQLSSSTVGKRKRRKGKKDPKMARALRKANAMGRKKNGGFKKGWSQGKIMSKAHQLRRKM